VLASHSFRLSSQGPGTVEVPVQLAVLALEAAFGELAWAGMYYPRPQRATSTIVIHAQIVGAQVCRAVRGCASGLHVHVAVVPPRCAGRRPLCPPVARLTVVACCVAVPTDQGVHAAGRRARGVGLAVHGRRWHSALFCRARVSSVQRHSCHCRGAISRMCSGVWLRQLPAPLSAGCLLHPCALHTPCPPPMPAERTTPTLPT
jgi:hypothetical protein